MTEADKQEVFNKSVARRERDILVNQGRPTPLGTETVYVKALAWDDCDKFDEAIANAVRKFNEFTKIDINVQEAKIDLDSIISTIIEIIQQDLITIANAATAGLVTLDKVKSVGATRDDVVQIILKAFEVNYSSVKNLIALTKSMR
jgi:hypothetical protein